VGWEEPASAWTWSRPGADRRFFFRRIGTWALAAVVLLDAATLTAIGLGVFGRSKEIAAFKRSTQSPTLAQGVGPASLRETGQKPVRGCDRPTLIGTLTARSVAARVSPRPRATVIHRFAIRNVLGSPQVFDLVSQIRRKDGSVWYKALLPIRPNGTTGYIPAKSLSVVYTTYHLVVDRSKFTLKVFNGCRRLRTYRVGIGTGSTPTPVGRFYLTGLFKPPDPTTVYGVSVYTLSAFSEVLTSWRLGGIVGLHGTNDPSSIGRNSSHGCIRMKNGDILRLVRILPLGTPVVIR
jgi:hypothetical protein